MESIYSEKFFDGMFDKNNKTAGYIIPVILEKFKPRSIVDVGCGQGIFLAEVNRYNEDIEVLGIDGDWVTKLLIDKNDYYAFDISKKMNMNKKYDVAMSLEVAEHISCDAADIYIENLVSLSDIIIFSAAIPGQGGTGHINEQWPSYWKEKFSKYGYYVSDCLRNYFWQYEDLEPLRRQNILLYVTEKKFEDIEKKFSINPTNMLDVVHPEFFKGKIESVRFIADKYKRLADKYELINSYSYIDYGKAAEQLSSLTLWHLADEIEMIEELMENKLFFEKFKCCQLEDFLTINNKAGCIVWGAGEDGKKIKRLFKALKKEAVMWCDRDQAGDSIDKKEIITPLEMMKNYKNEVIIIASRKYQFEIIDEIISYNTALKDAVFLFASHHGEREI